MQREQALALVKERIRTRNLFKHTLAVEAVMRRLAAELGQDQDRWGLAGLLHDIDYEETKNDPDRHSQLGADMLAEMGLDEEIVEAVRAHNDRHGLPRTSLLAKALYSTDPLTGLIVAATLVHPERRLAAVDAQFVLNRFGEKSFARGANRRAISACEELGMTLERFIQLGLEAMQGIAEDLGL